MATFPSQLLEASNFPVSSACWIPSGASSVSCWPCHFFAKFQVVVPWRPAAAETPWRFHKKLGMNHPNTQKTWRKMKKVGVSTGILVILDSKH